MRYVYMGLLALMISTPAALIIAQEAEQEIPLFENDEEEDLTPEQEYDRLLRQIEGLITYNQLLERQIANQERALDQISGAMDQAPELERQIPALLTRMVDALEQFVQLDIPFLLEERTARVAELQQLIERGDVSDAEKLRRILEAWQVENDYGRAELGNVYTGQLEINGSTREVDFLQLGRIAFVYQTLDQEHTGVWDQRTRSWVPLGTTYRNPVRHAIRVGRAQIAPEMVLLPVPPPVEN